MLLFWDRIKPIFYICRKRVNQMAKYTEWLTDGANQGWARDGLIDEQIAKNMGVSYSTFRDWRKNFRHFRQP